MPVRREGPAGEPLTRLPRLGWERAALKWRKLRAQVSAEPGGQEGVAPRGAPGGRGSPRGEPGSSGARLQRAARPLAALRAAPAPVRRCGQSPRRARQR